MWQANLPSACTWRNSFQPCLSVNDLVLFLLFSVKQVMWTHLHHWFSFQERMLCVCVCVCVWLCAHMASSICHPGHGLWWHLVVKPTVWDAGIDRANGGKAWKMEWVRWVKRDWGAHRAPVTQGSLTCHAFWALPSLFWDWLWTFLLDSFLFNRRLWEYLTSCFDKSYQHCCRFNLSCTLTYCEL